MVCRVYNVALLFGVNDVGDSIISDYVYAGQTVKAWSWDSHEVYGPGDLLILSCGDLRFGVVLDGSAVQVPNSFVLQNRLPAIADYEICRSVKLGAEEKAHLMKMVAGEELSEDKLYLPFIPRNCRALYEYLTGELAEKVKPMAKWAHGLEHINKVLYELYILAEQYSLDKTYCAVIGTMHDLGLSGGRSGHERRSADILRNDSTVRSFFSDLEVQLMAEAIEDHRSSLATRPRSMYGMALSEADRDLRFEVIVVRYIRPRLTVIRDVGLDNVLSEIYEDLLSKYGSNGATQLWLQSARNTNDLAKLKQILRSESEFMLRSKVIAESYIEKLTA